VIAVFEEELRCGFDDCSLRFFGGDLLSALAFGSAPFLGPAGLRFGSDRRSTPVTFAQSTRLMPEGG
jgi:hypothetical protein